MDAVQRMRQKARDFGYLRSNGQIIVSGGPYIGIEPVDPAFVVGPTYDPLIVFAPPRPGFFVGGAIGFGFGVRIGGFFRPWGWGATRIGWGEHAFFVNGRPWGRTWENRRVYVHSYPEVRHYDHPVARVERHELIQRSAREREAPRAGRPHEEEHHHH